MQEDTRSDKRLTFAKEKSPRLSCSSDTLRMFGTEPAGMADGSGLEDMRATALLEADGADEVSESLAELRRESTASRMC